MPKRRKNWLETMLASGEHSAFGPYPTVDRPPRTKPKPKPINVTPILMHQLHMLGWRTYPNAREPYATHSLKPRWPKARARIKFRQDSNAPGGAWAFITVEPSRSDERAYVYGHDLRHATGLTLQDAAIEWSVLMMKRRSGG